MSHATSGTMNEFGNLADNTATADYQGRTRDNRKLEDRYRARKKYVRSFQQLFGNVMERK